MARYTRMATLAEMYRAGLVVVFYHPDPATCIEVAKACVEGGARLLEYTNRGDLAWQGFVELERYSAKHLPDLILGVGSIVDAHTAALYINSGASFVVGPVLNAEVARLCNRRKVPYSPGCGSATEVSEAEELGCEIVKVFPGAQVGGPEFVKNIRGPQPWTSLMPTGGVEPTEESLRAWFSAGIACAGIGSQLVTKEILASKDWSSLSARVRDALSIIAQVRGTQK